MSLSIPGDVIQESWLGFIFVEYPFKDRSVDANVPARFCLVLFQVFRSAIKKVIDP
jgi:hypothetical protein